MAPALASEFEERNGKAVALSAKQEGTVVLAPGEDDLVKVDPKDKCSFGPGQKIYARWNADVEKVLAEGSDTWTAVPVVRDVPRCEGPSGPLSGFSGVGISLGQWVR